MQNGSFRLKAQERVKAQSPCTMDLPRQHCAVKSHMAASAHVEVTFSRKNREDSVSETQLKKSQNDHHF